MTHGFSWCLLTMTHGFSLCLLTVTHGFSWCLLTVIHGFSWCLLTVIHGFSWGLLTVIHGFSWCLLSVIHGVESEHSTTDCRLAPSTHLMTPVRFVGFLQPIRMLFSLCTKTHIPVDRSGHVITSFVLKSE